MELARRAFVLWIVAALPSLAHQAIERGEYDRAVNCLDAYLAFNSDDARIHLMLGWAYFKKGAQDQAIDAYSDAIRLDPKGAAAFVGRGTSHGAAGQFDRAIADLTTALQLDPNAVDAYYNRGLVYSQKGQLDKARGGLRSGRVSTTRKRGGTPSSRASLCRDEEARAHPRRLRGRSPAPGGERQRPTGSGGSADNLPGREGAQHRSR